MRHLMTCFLFDASGKKETVGITGKIKIDGG